MLAALALTSMLAPAQEPDAPAAQVSTPQEAYEAWWQGVVAQPLPALRSGFVFEGSATSPEADAPRFTMRVDGTLHYRDAAHVRVEGRLSAAADDGTSVTGQFSLWVGGERMYMTGGIQAWTAKGTEDESFQGSASLATAKLRDSARFGQEIYESIGMGALGVGDSILESEVGDWLHPVIMARSTIEQLRVERFALGEELATCTLVIDVDAFREAMDGVMRMAGIDEEPELRREFEAEMAPLYAWIRGLSFEMALDAATGLPQPLSVSVSLPQLMLGEGEPPVTVTGSARLVEPDLAPVFAEGLFTPPEDVTWFDLDPFLDMALGMLRAMALEAQAEMDAEF